MNLQKLFKATVPDLLKYLGKSVIIPDVGKVKIDHICGNKFKPNYYEINGEHLISMLRFHAQMMKAKDITEEQFLQFEAMEVVAEKMPDKDKETHGEETSFTPNPTQ